MLGKTKKGIFKKPKRKYINLYQSTQADLLDCNSRGTNHLFLLQIQPHALCIPAIWNRFHHLILAHPVHCEICRIKHYGEFLLHAANIPCQCCLRYIQGRYSQSCLLLRYSCLIYNTSSIILCIHKHLQNYRWDEGQRRNNLIWPIVRSFKHLSKLLRSAFLFSFNFLLPSLLF